MKISLIVATYGRNNELRNLLRSIASQDYKNFEVIIIDQNQDDRVHKILQDIGFTSHSVTVVKQKSKNLSEARNRGMREASGEIVFFPDDDCQLPENFFSTVVQKFNEHEEMDFLSVPVLDPATNEVYTAAQGCEVITKRNARTLTTGSGILFRRQVAEKLQNFDPCLGLGGEFESSEDLDFVLRALYAGYKGYYYPRTFVIHEDPLKAYNKLTAQRAYRYNRGFGALVKKHLKVFGNRHLLLVFICECLKNFSNMVVHWPMNPARAEYNYLSLIGKIEGFFKYRSSR